MFVLKMNFMRLFIVLFLLIGFQSLGAINRERFYSVFESNSLDEINKEIQLLTKEKSSPQKDAFLGAMVMKRAQFLKTPKDKISVFKEGKNLLESAIKSQPKNAEFRFLRLAIQENCPKILKYNTNKEEDSKTITSRYSTMHHITKKHVKKYALHSQQLNL